MKHHLSCASLLAVLTFAAASSPAEVRLPALFSDNMVLQQGTKAPVWGWADDGEQVTVRFRGQSLRTTTKNGKWMVKLKALNTGGPDDLVVEGKNRIEIKNVLVGEVWVCSGQSNMELPIERSFESTNDIAASANAKLRLFKAPHVKASKPQTDVKAAWRECAPETLRGFSAVAYYFGRDLQRARNVPVALIETCWGGSPAEVWMSQEALASNPTYKRDILDAYDSAARKAAESTPPGRKPQWRPTELYDGMIAPLIPYAIKGAIWYQGESNAGRAHEYRTLFPDMIRNWRRDWGAGDFTFWPSNWLPTIMPKKGPSKSLPKSPSKAVGPSCGRLSCSQPRSCHRPEWP